jgi:hypothetical protein
VLARTCGGGLGVVHGTRLGSTCQRLVGGSDLESGGVRRRGRKKLGSCVENGERRGGELKDEYRLEKEIERCSC